MFRQLYTAAAGVVLIYLSVFFFLRVIPGDPAETMLGESASAADVARLRKALGTDRPALTQLTDGLRRHLRGDFGKSFVQRRPVTVLIGQRFGTTVRLALLSIAIAILIAFPLGLMAAARRGTGIDRALSALSLTGVSIPTFWLGPLLILLFAVRLEWLPTGGIEGGASWILPSFTLGAALAAMLTRMLRASAIEAISAPHTRTALAKGVSVPVFWMRHVVRNALLPVLTILGLQIGALLSGAVVTETVFALPGLGRLLVTAIQQRDYPVVEGCVTVLAIIVMTVNRLTDFAYRLSDPRTREPASAT